METIQALLNIVLHLDQYLSTYISFLGYWSYLLLFIVIFCETGLVITPFLPGDSLLFAVGLTAASTTLNINLIAPLLVLAAVCGDSCNYFIGRFVGKKIFKPDARILKTAYLDKSQAFFNKYGGRAIILARFTPIIRTLLPFTAGMSKMNYPRFVLLGFVGAVIWVYSILYLAFMFSNNIYVRKYFGVLVILIVIVSILPPMISAAKSLRIKLAGRKSSS